MTTAEVTATVQYDETRPFPWTVIDSTGTEVNAFDCEADAAELAAELETADLVDRLTERLGTMDLAGLRRLAGQLKV